MFPPGDGFDFGQATRDQDVILLTSARGQAQWEYEQSLRGKEIRSGATLTRSAGDDVRVPEALGVVEYGNDRGRHSEQANLVRGRHFHRQRRGVRVLQGKHAARDVDR